MRNIINISNIDQLRKDNYVYKSEAKVILTASHARTSKPVAAVWLVCRAGGHNIFIHES